MKQEVLAAVMFFIRFIEKSDTFPRDQLDNFKKYLTELLIERFEKHWFPEVPSRGQGYRCIRVNCASPVDLTLQAAAVRCGRRYQDLRLPAELTVWVDPSEVCYRLGESEGSYCTLASFPSEQSLSDAGSTSSSSSASSASSGGSAASSPAPSPPATPPQPHHQHHHHSAARDYHHHQQQARRAVAHHGRHQQQAQAQQQRWATAAPPPQQPQPDFGKWQPQPQQQRSHQGMVRGKPSPREMNFNFNPNRPMYRCDGPPYPLNPAFYRNMNYNRSYHKNVLRV